MMIVISTSRFLEKTTLFMDIFTAHECKCCFFCLDLDHGGGITSHFEVFLGQMGLC